ncbi:MAG: hypothetical protein E6552_12215, partial [Sutterella wadsworthensis]|nr:hypothetical protein [Sutterella wadsworthensis]
MSANSRPSGWRGLAESGILSGSFDGEEPLCSCISLTFLPSYAFKINAPLHKRQDRTKNSADIQYREKKASEGRSRSNPRFDSLEFILRFGSPQQLSLEQWNGYRQ